MSRTEHDIRGFTPGGKAHRMLDAMEDGPQYVEGLYDATEADTPNKKRSVRFVGYALMDAGFVTRSDGIYTIKPAGRDLLDALDSPIPTVRVFATNQKESVQ